MIRTLLILLAVLPLALPAQIVFAEGAHTGVAGSRSMPELSDLALAVVAVIGVWLARRAMRARARKRVAAGD